MSESRKIILSKQSINQPSSSNTSPIAREYPPLPIHQNRFAPIAPRTRPPYSALAQIPPNRIPIIPTFIPRTPQNISHPRSTQASTSQASTSITTEYHINPNRQVIKILEPLEEQKLSQGFHILTDYLFPKYSHFYVDDYKTREYYQTILIDSGSVIIEHTQNQKNPEYIDYSKVKINKIITPEEWSLKPYNHKTLSSFPQYPIYNYYDYQEAWFYAFLLRSFNHTWFFYFSDKFARVYPRWFIKWFRYFGSISDIFPPRISEGFHKYKNFFMEDHITSAEYVLNFVNIFKLPWIVLFTYKKQESQDTSPPLLYRQFSVKWWKKIEDSQADIKAVTEYCQKYIQEKEGSSSPSSSSHVQDQEFIRRLQKCSTPEEMQRIINEIKSSPTPSEELYQDAQDPYDDITL